jgi:hypothetical protein
MSDFDHERTVRNWRRQGLGQKASWWLAGLRCVNAADVRRLGYDGLIRTPGLGKITVREIGRVLFSETWPPLPRISQNIDDAALIAELRRRGYKVEPNDDA